MCLTKAIASAVSAGNQQVNYADIQQTERTDVVSVEIVHAPWSEYFTRIVLFANYFPGLF